MQARQQSDKSLQTCFDDCKREFERVLKEAHVCRPAQCHGWQDSKHTLDGQSRASAGLSTVIFEYFWWFIDTQGLFTISTGAWFFSWTGWSFYLQFWKVCIFGPLIFFSSPRLSCPLPRKGTTCVELHSKGLALCFAAFLAGYWSLPFLPISQPTWRYLHLRLL